MNFNKYIGIPWKKSQSDLNGADCWGLVKMILKEKFFIFPKIYKDETIESIQFNIDSETWIEHKKPAIGDVCIFFNRNKNFPEHVGVFVGGGKIIHSLNNASIITDIRFLKRLYKGIEYYAYNSNSL